MSSEISEMVWWCTTETVVSHWGTKGVSEGTERTWMTERNQKGVSPIELGEAEGLALLDCPAPEARG
jgi:hypothetical protein